MMENKADNDDLLADVLAETAPADFRDAMLGKTLRLVRRRRRWRQTRHTAGVVVVLGLLGIFVRQKNLPQPPVAPAPVAKAIEKNYKLVRTESLPANDIVVTKPLVAGQFVASVANVEMVQTMAGNFRVINDEELLALVTPHPAILIRTGKNSEQLVFANPEDEKGFPLN
jgi:hypothetical protein